MEVNLLIWKGKSCNFFSLWRFGGAYLDLDVISQTSLESIQEENFACAQRDDLTFKDSIACGIIRMEGNYGQHLAEQCLEWVVCIKIQSDTIKVWNFRDFITNFNEEEWGWNGPDLITRILRKSCRLPDRMASSSITCSNFTILPKDKCYSIHFTEWPMFFKRKFVDEAMRRTKESFFVHFWNNMSENFTLSTSRTSAYTKLARKFCPNVLQASGNWF